MSRFSEKGYFVKENAPVYLTEDMSKTVKWFEEIMGWYGNVVEKDELGNGLYGVVFDILPEIEITHLAPFTGFQLFKGKPEPRAISFMQVKNIEKMYSYIILERRQVMKMLRFEIKKVFSKTKNRITIIVLLVILIATVF